MNSWKSNESVIMKNITLLLFLALSTVFGPLLVNAQNFWEPGYGPIGRNVDAIVINSEGHIFAGARFPGIYRSTDNGENWYLLNTGLTSTQVFSLAVNSQDVIFAGTSDGIFRSTNNGETWEQKSVGLNQLFVSSLVINSDNHIFAGTGSWTGRIYRSTNNGDSWEEVLIVPSPTNPTVTALHVNHNGDILAGLHGPGAYKSTDNGDNWQEVNTGLTNSYVFSFANDKDGNILTGTWGGIFRSQDNGDSWTKIDTGTLNGNALSLVVNNQGHIFAGIIGLGGVIRSNDNGNSWVKVFNNSLDVNAMALNEEGHVFAGDHLNIFRTTDNGDNWSWINSHLTRSSVASLAIGKDGDIFSGTTDRGVFRSSDKGNNWERVNNGLSNMDVRSIVTRPNGDTFAGTFGGGVFYSANDGESWTPSNTGLTSLAIGALYFSSDNQVFAGSSRTIFRSENNGETWETVHQFPGSSSLPPVVVAFATNQSGHIFAGFTGFFEGGIFRSTDGGDTWSLCFQNAVLAVVVDASGSIFAGTASGIYRSKDEGDTWEHLQNGVGSRRINSILATSENYLFAGSEGGGVFQSTDGGENWIPVNIGLLNFESNPVLSIKSLTANDIGYVYVGVSGGVFRSVETFGSPVIPVVSVSIENPTNNISGSFFLDQNYPNPFNLETSIHYRLPRNSSVKLEIFNTLGQRVITLVDEFQSEGEHYVLWNGQDGGGHLVTSGTYVYKLTAGNFVQSKKILFLE